ncbi:hypothetical protein N0M98_15040 [Paenibacillus doosanensis]|uniref:hypothetical protein n=1 Tax=Paenibacillus doosanensis TaxID=1229154 RepID=UPI00217FB87F|nr:hypothetical protein [Paenibacillus doosanensis]MCS7461466.1 hypothetical protein [Paenibacillus doosanensis]
MKPALEKFLLIAATLAAIGIFIFVALWGSIKEKKTQMDDLFNNTNVPTSYHYQITPADPDQGPKSGADTLPPPSLTA